MKVAVIGLGRVGRSVQELFGRHHEVVAWDSCTGDPYPKPDLAGCDFAVVSVGTPRGPDGAADLSGVRDAVARVPVERVLLKSTVPPGTTDGLVCETGKQIVHWPEYVGESVYVNPYFPVDIAETPFVILGGEPAARHWFIDRLIPILGPTKTYFQCTSRESEVIKYAENAFFATKITYANELRRICEALGADWHTVREGWVLDPRVNPMHTAAFTDPPGFGGRCLPKDLDALIHSARAAGYAPALLEQVRASNDVFRGPGATDKPGG